MTEYSDSTVMVLGERSLSCHAIGRSLEDFSLHILTTLFKEDVVR